LSGPERSGLGVEAARAAAAIKRAIREYGIGFRSDRTASGIFRNVKPVERPTARGI